MQFTVQGTLLGAVYTITWCDGIVLGDRVAVSQIRARASMLEGTRVGPPLGPWTTRAHLYGARSASIVIGSTFDEILDWVGDWPRPSPQLLPRRARLLREEAPRLTA
jgi:hypothetical protein